MEYNVLGADKYAKMLRHSLCKQKTYQPNGNRYMLNALTEVEIKYTEFRGRNIASSFGEGSGRDTEVLETKDMLHEENFF